MTSQRDVQETSIVNDATSLLRILNDEVSRLRGSERSGLEQLEVADRDAKRTSALLQLTLEQLNLLKDANMKLQTKQADLQTVLLHTQKDAADKLEETNHLHNVVRDTNATHSATVRRLETDLQILQQKLAAQEKCCESLRGEIAAGKLREESMSSERERESRVAFETKTALEVRLQQKTTELSDIEHLRVAERKEVMSREYELSKLVNELRKANTDAAEASERQRKADFMMITGLKAENEELRHRMTTTQKSLTQETHENMETIERLRQELTMQKERSEEAKSAFEAREKVMEIQIARFCSDLKSAQSEINAMADREGGILKSSSESQIALRARNDVLKLRVEALELEILQTKDKLRTTIVGHASEIDKIKAEHAALLQQQLDATNAKSQALQHLSMDLRVAESRLRSVEEELRQTVERSSRTTSTQASEIQALKVEMEGYKNAVKKLEEHIENNFEMRILNDRCNQQQSEIDSLKERLRHANQTIANTRIESDISESYRFKMLQEEFETELSRVTALERERQSARGLLQALIEAVRRQNTEPLDLSLASEIDQFYRMFGNG